MSGTKRFEAPRSHVRHTIFTVIQKINFFGRWLMEAAEAPLSTCRVLTEAWIPPVKDTTAGSARTFDKRCFHSNSMHMIHTNQITCGVLWQQKTMLCNSNERAEDHLTLPTAVWLIKFLLFVCVLFGCAAVWRWGCARAGACVRGGVARGKLMNACAGSAGCPLSNIIQSLSNLPACDMHSYRNPHATCN